MCSRQIAIKIRAITTGIAPKITSVRRLTDDAGAPITLISPEAVIAARTCPTAAEQLQRARAERNLKIYQTALTAAHLLAQQINDVEDLAAAKGSAQ